MTAAAEPTTMSTGAGNGRRGVLAGVAIGAISLIGAWHPSKWSDESATITAAERSLSELWRMVGTIDLVHGFYYLTMHFWVRLFGISELALRVPSAIALGVAGACVYWWGARLGGRQLAFLAAVVFGILPRAFWAGAEARPLAMTLMFAAAMSLVLLVALDTDARAAWVGYSVLLLAGVLCNLYVGFLVPAHLVSLVLDRKVTREQRRRWVAHVAVPLLLCAPFLLEAFGQRDQIGVRRLGVVELARNVVFNQWFLGDTPTASSRVSISSLELGDVGSWWPVAAVLLAGVGWLLMAYAVFHRGPADEPEADDGRSPLVWLVPAVVLPTAVIGLYSVVSSSLYNARYLTFAAPATALLVAVGLLAIRAPRLRTAAIVVLALLAIPIFVSQRQEHGKNDSDWRSVAEHIEDRAAPGDGIYFAPRYEQPGRLVGRTTRGILTAYPDAFAGLSDVTLVESPESAGDLTGRSTRLLDSADNLASIDTLWVIRRADYPSRRAEEEDGFLAAEGFRLVSEWDGTLDVVLEFERAG